MITFDDTIPEAGHPVFSRHWAADLVFNRRLRPPADSGGKSIRIAVVTHGPTTLPGVFRNADIYFPIQVGRSVNPAIPDIIGFDHYRRFLDWRAMTEDRDRLATLSPLERRKYGFIMELVGGYWFWHEQRHGRLKTKGTRLRFYNISNPTNGTSYPARKIK